MERGPKFKRMGSVELFTEQKFPVIMEEVEIPLSPSPSLNLNVDESRILCSCAEEIKYLKETVKQLISQVNRQGRMITGIKSGLQSAVLSLASCYSDDKPEETGYLNQDVDYSNGHQLTRVSDSEVDANFEDSLLQQAADYNLPRRQYEQIEDPLQEITGSSSVAIKNCATGAGENINNSSITTQPSSQAIILTETELVNEDTESTCDLDENEDDDKLYTPSESEECSDHDFENEKTEKQTSSDKIDVEPDGDKDLPESAQLFRCTKCPKEYKTMRTLRDHMRRYHSKNPYKCDLCDKVYVKSSSLAHHIHSVHKGHRLQCAYCPGSFVQLGKLRVHEKIHLMKDGPPLQCCEFCGMNFRTVKSLLAHLGSMHKDVGRKHYAIGVKAVKNKYLKRK